ncbi:hypothetical protein [Novipirellula artificiosorum]|uniref:hypothetical protein n=1 Tax=Novipirellula artificiosorum TaxID=2528016 RepID=UPI0018CF2990|nr:hypothetical protein [Novipirellula artificiosorum]
MTLDPVAIRLAEAGQTQSTSAIEWLEAQHFRSVMVRRAIWCTAAGWLLVLLAAAVASFVAVRLSMDVYKMAEETSIRPYGQNPWRLLWVPAVMVAFTIFLVVGGIVGSLLGIIPGYRATRSAIDWSAATDAVTRLLSVGCTYPEAFSTAAQIVRDRGSRNWLTQSAARVERGESVISQPSQTRKDAAMLEAFLSPSGNAPENQWRLAADHFLRLSRSRLTLLTQSMPLISTILAGVLIWLSISTSLAWFWLAVSDLLTGLT